MPSPLALQALPSLVPRPGVPQGPLPSPVSAATQSKGREAAAVSKVREAIALLQQAVPLVEPGTPLAESILNSMKSLGKHAPPAAADPGVQMTDLKNLLAKAQSQSPLSALGRLLGTQGGAGTPGESPLPGGPNA